MEVCKTLAIFTVLTFLDFSVCGLKAYPRHSRSERIQMKRDEPNYFKLIDMCNGYELFDVTPASLVSSDDRLKVSLIESSMSFERNSSSKPDEFHNGIYGPYDLTFCLGGGNRLDAVDNDDGSRSLSVVSAVEEPSYRFSWLPVSIRESSLTGNYIVDLAVHNYNLYVAKYCLVTLVDNNLTMSPEDCSEPDFSFFHPLNVTVEQLLTFHGIRFFYPSGPGGQWFGLFYLCADRECKERVVEIQHNEEIIPLKPVVLTTEVLPK